VAGFGGVVADFGRDWRCWRRLGIKYYPFHSAGQTILDNCRTLRADGAFGIDDVEHVTVGLSSFMYEHDKMLLPATTLADANFSLSYATAVGLRYGPEPLHHAGASAELFVTALDDDQTRWLAARTSFEPSPALDEENPYTMDTIVAVRTTDGREFTARTRYGVKGEEPGAHTGIHFSPIDDDGIDTKFLNLARPVAPGSTAQDILGLMKGLVDAESALGLIEACVSPGPRR
jgi:2-methylcitrate dehydratase PrpD